MSVPRFVVVTGRCAEGRHNAFKVMRIFEPDMFVHDREARRETRAGIWLRRG